MKKALISPIENNRVVEIKDVEFEIAEPLFWVNCPDDCAIEWTYSEGVFSPPADPEPVIPQTISMRQCRIALLRNDLLDQVDAAIADGTEEDKLTWEYATEVNRDDPMVINFGAALGLTSEQIDDLFVFAATL